MSVCKEELAEIDSTLIAVGNWQVALFRHSRAVFERTNRTLLYYLSFLRRRWCCFGDVERSSTVEVISVTLTAFLNRKPTHVESVFGMRLWIIFSPICIRVGGSFLCCSERKNKEIKRSSKRQKQIEKLVQICSDLMKSIAAKDC